MKVFLSSTFKDLIEYRLAATETLERLGQNVGRMEVFGARPAEPEESSLEEIEECDLFVGIYAHRYGHIPKRSKHSITEAEFRHALDHGKQLFCFLVEEDHPWPPKMVEAGPGKAKLKEFKTTVSDHVQRDTFTTPEDLALKIATSVGRYLRQQPAEIAQPNPSVPVARIPQPRIEVVPLSERGVHYLEVSNSGVRALFRAELRVSRGSHQIERGKAYEAAWNVEIGPKVPRTGRLFMMSIAEPETECDLLSGQRGRILVGATEMPEAPMFAQSLVTYQPTPEGLLPLQSQSYLVSSPSMPRPEILLSVTIVADPPLRDETWLGKYLMTLESLSEA